MYFIKKISYGTYTCISGFFNSYEFLKEIKILRNLFYFVFYNNQLNNRSILFF